MIKEFYNDPELYSRQIPAEETKRGIRRLMQIADVFYTAVSPHFMGVRAEQIMTQFQELAPENIILGSAKDRVHFDIVLDDAIHNILDSKAEYPVLMRKPWNAKMTGLLSVNTMAEFVSLVRQIMKASTSKPEKITLRRYLHWWDLPAPGNVRSQKLCAAAKVEIRQRVSARSSCLCAR